MASCMFFEGRDHHLHLDGMKTFETSEAIYESKWSTTHQQNCPTMCSLSKELQPMQGKVDNPQVQRHGIKRNPPKSSSCTKPSTTRTISEVPGKLSLEPAKPKLGGKLPTIIVVHLRAANLHVPYTFSRSFSIQNQLDAAVSALVSWYGGCTCLPLQSVCVCACARVSVRSGVRAREHARPRVCACACARTRVCVRDTLSLRAFANAWFQT